MRILHHGARDGVTGSCHQLLIDARHSLLVDCGLFQGAETGPEGQGVGAQDVIGFDVSTVRALIATHVHIDHVGRIPQLLAAGFKGPILCSEPSARLLPLVLEDAFRLGISRDARRLERYLGLIEQRIVALPYKHWFTVIDSAAHRVRVRLQRAGHILGSAYVECEVLARASGEKTRVVFSGDLGAPHAPLLPAPQPPYAADILVLESTYGDREHEPRAQRRRRLQAVLERALADGGTVLIPAFSIGRTQELLYEIEDIVHRMGLPAHGRASGESSRSGMSAAMAPAPQAASTPLVDWPALPVILDSPLASRFTEIYRQLQAFWDAEALQRVRRGRDPLAFANLLTVDSHAQHLAMLRHLRDTRRPAIVIAASGMCAGGRIIDYLKAMLGDPRHNVLFVGHQAQGTPGRTIQKYGPRGGYVELDGERIVIRAGIETLGGYSAHADRRGLLGFATRMRHWPREIRLVHGEAQARQHLAEALRARYAQRGLPLVVR